MTNREYLQTIKRYDDEIHELKVLLRDNPDDEEIINDIKEIIKARKIALRDILKRINEVENIDYRLLLIKRYIHKKSMKRIRREMNYSYEYMYEILKKAESEIHLKKS